LLENKSKGWKTPHLFRKRDNCTRLYNGKVLETNEQRVSKQNNHSHRNPNLYGSGTHSSMREIIVKFITFKPFVVNCTIFEIFRAGNKVVDSEET